jgi:hypothetical protein
LSLLAVCICVCECVCVRLNYSFAVFSRSAQCALRLTFRDSDGRKRCVEGVTCLFTANLLTFDVAPQSGHATTTTSRLLSSLPPFVPSSLCMCAFVRVSVPSGLPSCSPCNHVSVPSSNASLVRPFVRSSVRASPCPVQSPCHCDLVEGRAVDG